MSRSHLSAVPLDPAPLPGAGITVRVALDHEHAQASGTTVLEAAEVLRELTQDLLPGAVTQVSVTLDARAVLPVRGRAEPIDAGRRSGLELDLDRRRVRVDGEEVGLTYREFELFAYLARSGGRALRRREIFAQVWGLEFVGHERTIDVHVRRLRAKLGPYASRIRTLRGIGYRFEAA